MGYCMEQTLRDAAEEIFREEVLDGEDRELGGAADYQRDIVLGQMMHLATAAMRRWARECREPFSTLLGEQPAPGSTAWVCTLGDDAKAEVERRLREAGVSGDDLDRAMRSRLCDLSDTIDVGGIAETQSA